MLVHSTLIALLGVPQGSNSDEAGACWEDPVSFTDISHSHGRDLGRLIQLTLQDGRSRFWWFVLHSKLGRAANFVMLGGSCCSPVEARNDIVI